MVLPRVLRRDNAVQKQSFEPADQFYECGMTAVLPWAKSKCQMWRGVSFRDPRKKQTPRAEISGVQLESVLGCVMAEDKKHRIACV
jgi:hypothetical protein